MSTKTTLAKYRDGILLPRAARKMLLVLWDNHQTTVPLTVIYKHLWPERDYERYSQLCIRQYAYYIRRWLKRNKPGIELVNSWGEGYGLYRVGRDSVDSHSPVLGGTEVNMGRSASVPLGVS